MSVKPNITPVVPAFPRLPISNVIGGGTSANQPILRGGPAPSQPANPGNQAGLTSISSVTFGVRLAGTVNKAFPLAIRVATQGFRMNINVVGVSLSSSLLNTSADAVIGLFVSKDTGPVINLSSSSDLYVAHQCESGLGHSFVSGIGFADDISPRISSNERLAIYACSSGSGIATNRLSGIVTIRFLQTH